MLHRITFVADVDNGLRGFMPCIDGQPFDELIRTKELLGVPPHREDLRDWATSDDGPITAWLINGLKEVPTVADENPRTVEKAVALVCGCGEEGCGRTWVDLTVTPDLVSWSNVRTWITDYMPYQDFGPWSFDRAQYESECERVAMAARSGNQLPE